MNYKKTIGKMLFGNAKTELSSKRIELGITDDIQKSISTNKQAIGEVKAIISEFEDAKKAFQKAEADALKVKNSADKKAQKFEKLDAATDKLIARASNAAKALGVNTNDIDGFKELESVSLELAMEANQILNFNFNLGQ